MAYTTENIIDMSWDEYTYEVDMMLIAEFGEPATHAQLCDITTAYNNGVAPDAVFAAIADTLSDGDDDHAWGFPVSAAA